MSQEEHRQIAGAITYPEGSDPSNIDHNVPQPRQPTSLHGLLRFAMDATKSEDAPGASNQLPLDEEVKKNNFFLLYL